MLFSLKSIEYIIITEEKEELFSLIHEEVEYGLKI